MWDSADTVTPGSLASGAHGGFRHAPLLPAGSARPAQAHLHSGIHRKVASPKDGFQLPQASRTTPLLESCCLRGF